MDFFSAHPQTHQEERDEHGDDVINQRESRCKNYPRKKKRNHAATATCKLNFRFTYSPIPYTDFLEMESAVSGYIEMIYTFESFFSRCNIVLAL